MEIVIFPWVKSGVGAISPTPIQQVKHRVTYKVAAILQRRLQPHGNDMF